MRERNYWTNRRARLLSLTAGGPGRMAATIDAGTEAIVGESPRTHQQRTRRGSSPGDDRHTGMGNGHFDVTDLREGRSAFAD